MYLLKLVFRNIIKMYRESRAIFLYISFGIIAAIFGLLFYSGYLMTYFSSGNTINELSIEFENEESKELILQIISDTMNESSLDSVYVYSGNQGGNGEIVTVGMYDARYNEHMCYGKFYEKTETKPYAVISDVTAERLGIFGVVEGKEIAIGDIKYEILGMHRSAQEICIPPLYYIENFDVNSIRAEFNKRLSDKFLSKIENYGIKYKLKNNEDIFSSGEFVFNFIMVILIFSVSFLNIFAMFSFWKTRMKNTFSVYFICGCKNLEKLILISGIVTVTIIINSMIGFGAFLILFRKFTNLGVIARLPYMNYLMVFLFVLMILVVYACIFGVYHSETSYSRDGKDNI